MKSFICLLFTIISITSNAQTMDVINETVTRLFVATDSKDWETVEDIFDKTVLLDYSSMNGNPAVELTPRQITDSWKTILPGFTYTHHQLGNFISSEKGNKAEVFCYGTATHYLEDKNGNVWTVVGSYDFELNKSGQTWKISKMKFNFKYQDGNTGLPAKAMKRLENKDYLTDEIAAMNKANTRDFLKALEAMDVDAVVDLFAEDGIHINPYASGIFSDGAKGQKAIRAYWEPVFPNFESMQFPIEEIYAMEDPSRVFVKFSGKIELKDNNGWYNNQYYATFKFNENGKIVEYVEIFNPIVAAKGFGLIDKIK